MELTGISDGAPAPAQDVRFQIFLGHATQSSIARSMPIPFSVIFTAHSLVGTTIEIIKRLLRIWNRLA